MFTLVQLMDGCYRVTVDFVRDGIAVHYEWIFAVTTSDAEPDPAGERIVVKFE